MQLERILQKHGFGTRKGCRSLIRHGRVAIGGVVCDDPFAEIETEGLVFTVDGADWPYAEFACLMLHKPAGYECSRKPQHHPSVLTLLPLPTWLAVMKPMALALVLTYFALEAPEVAGLGHAFLFGLAADVLYGGLLGEHALRMVILVYLTLRFRHRLRFFPVWQQAGSVFGLLLNDRVLDLWIRLMSGSTWPPLLFWLSPAMRPEAPVNPVPVASNADGATMPDGSASPAIVLPDAWGEHPDTAAIQPIIEKHCVACHAAQPKLMASAPKGTMLDTPERIDTYAALVHKQAVELKVMPPGNMTRMTDAELAAHPYAGGLFAWRLPDDDAPGIIEPRYAG